MIKDYNIADINIRVNSCVEYKNTEEFNPFVSNDMDDIDMEVNIIGGNSIINFNKEPLYKNLTLKIYKEDNKLYRVVYMGNQNNILSYLVENQQNSKEMKCEMYIDHYSKQWNSWDIFSMIGFEYMLNLHNINILHSSFISYKNKAIIFTAPSQSGKSTQANLWQQYKNAEVVNGDRCAIKKVNNKWYAYGLPYAGTSLLYKNEKREIGAIVVLRQASKNIIKKLSKAEAFKYIYSETTINFWNNEYVRRASDTIEGLVNNVPVYMLHCLPNKEAVDLLKNELQWG
ncbi:hypothetical protein TPELB_09860 [Terrisporobacter petrolearius]|uniref:SynChlorMet cassette protein ScmC n=1 Tax=Terrisporobacter petrolearius TaxID=1460447 RepID=A0ABZ3FA54_9FIRM